MNLFNRRSFAFGAALCLFAVSNACPFEGQKKARGLPEKLAVTSSQQQFSSYMFQSAIKSERNLSALVEETDFIGDEAAAMGFGAKSPEARFFILGTLYSQSLACLNGGDATGAAERLKAIEREFIGLQAPSSLYNYAAKMRTTIQTGQYTPTVLIDFLGVFEPFLEDYALARGNDMALLLHAGSWLVNFSLAAAADDKVLIGQTQKLRYFREEMQRMDAPKGVLDSLDQLITITEKERVSEGDAKTILNLVNQIQQVLG